MTSAFFTRSRFRSSPSRPFPSPSLLLPLAILAALLVAAWPHPLARADDEFPSIARRLKLRDFSVAGRPAEAVLVVHYRRSGDDYDGWNLWCWPEGGEGSQSNLSGSDAFGRYAVVPVADASRRLGFLIRKGNWEEKDFDQDRFVTLQKGKVTEIWVKSGEDAFTSDPSRVDTAVRPVGAFLDGDETITLALTAPWKDAKTSDARVLCTREGGRAPRLVSVKPTGNSGDKRLYELKLDRPVASEDIASLRLEFPKGALAGTPPLTVLARDVLDGPQFTATDARLGAFVANGSTTFTTWSPVSEAVDLLLYERNAANPTRTISLARGAKGIWSATVADDLHGTPYRYRFRSYGESREAPDMHGFAANSDSSRTVVVDLDRLKPEGFDATTPPQLAQPTDEIIYEVHVRDYSQRDPRASDAVRGTYLGLVHDAPATADAPASGIDHLRELGITAVHLLPVHDYTAKVGEYNWGYWTTLFNVPESNYATDPGDPFSAIRDMRTAVSRLHAAGVRVILDVVYNHTSDAGHSSPFGAAVPGYFFRTTRDGRLMNDSGTGNALADERPMVRKYIVDSLEHWLRHYRVDGFRFDLLGCHRPETVRAACERVKAIRPDATLYGEPWTGGGPIHFGKGAQKGLPIAVFNDHLRNAIRGDLDGTAVGFATGEGGDAAAIRRGIAGAIDDFTAEPTETINYASAHDNLILWDKIAKTQPGASDAERRAMQKLSLGIVLTSQGIPFIHGGCDFGRTKKGNHNSYDAGDDINDFGWTRKLQYDDIFRYTAGLVKLRREHPAFRMDDDAEVRRAIAFSKPERPLSFTIDGRVAGDAWSSILVAFNDEPRPMDLVLPSGEWTVVVDASRAGTAPLARVRGKTTLPPYSMLVAHRD